MEISNSDDIIDSRAVIARIEELEESKMATCGTCDGKGEVPGEDGEEPEDCEDCGGIGQVVALDDDEIEELAALKALQEEAGGYSEDWKYGVTLIRDDYFEDYARQLAEDIGAIDRNATWPLGCIDWERAALELQMDYTSVEFGDVTYWVR